MFRLTLRHIYSWCYSFDRVSDEKEARGYLQALASKMTEELDGLKSSGYATLPRVRTDPSQINKQTNKKINK